MSTTQPQGETQNVGITAEQRQHSIEREAKRLSDAAGRIASWSAAADDAGADTRELIENELLFVEDVLKRLRGDLAAPLA